jgi:hypothetical protein
MSQPLLITLKEIRDAIYCCDISSEDKKSDLVNGLSDNFHYMLAAKMVQDFYDNIMKFWNDQKATPEQKLDSINRHYQKFKVVPDVTHKTRTEYRNLNALLFLWEIINARYTTRHTKKENVYFNSMRDNLFFYHFGIIDDGVVVDFDTDAYVTPFAQYYYDMVITDVTFDFTNAKTNNFQQVSLHQLIFTSEIVIQHVNYYFYKQSLDAISRPMKMTRINQIGNIKALPILKIISDYFQKYETMKGNPMSSNKVPNILMRGNNFRRDSFEELRKKMKKDKFWNELSIVSKTTQPDDLMTALEEYMQCLNVDVKTIRLPTETLLRHVYDKIMSTKYTLDHIEVMLQSETIDYISRPDIILMEYCLGFFFKSIVNKKNFVSYFESNYISKSATEKTFTHRHVSFADDEPSLLLAQEGQQPPPPPSVAHDIPQVGQERSEQYAHFAHFGVNLASQREAQIEAGTGQERNAGEDQGLPFFDDDVIFGLEDLFEDSQTTAQEQSDPSQVSNLNLRTRQETAKEHLDPNQFLNLSPTTDSNTLSHEAGVDSNGRNFSLFRDDNSNAPVFERTLPAADDLEPNTHKTGPTMDSVFEGVDPTSRHTLQDNMFALSPPENDGENLDEFLDATKTPEHETKDTHYAQEVKAMPMSDQNKQSGQVHQVKQATPPSPHKRPAPPMGSRPPSKKTHFQPLQHKFKQDLFDIWDEQKFPSLIKELRNEYAVPKHIPINPKDTLTASLQTFYDISQVSNLFFPNKTIDEQYFTTLAGNQSLPACDVDTMIKWWFDRPKRAYFSFKPSYMFLAENNGTETSTEEVKINCFVICSTEFDELYRKSQSNADEMANIYEYTNAIYQQKSCQRLIMCINSSNNYHLVCMERTDFGTQLKMYYCTSDEYWTPSHESTQDRCAFAKHLACKMFANSEDMEDCTAFGDFEQIQCGNADSWQSGYFAVWNAMHISTCETIHKYKPKNLEMETFLPWMQRVLFMHKPISDGELAKNKATMLEKIVELQPLLPQDTKENIGSLTRYVTMFDNICRFVNFVRNTAKPTSRTVDSCNMFQAKHTAILNFLQDLVLKEYRRDVFELKQIYVKNIIALMSFFILTESSYREICKDPELISKKKNAEAIIRKEFFYCDGKDSKYFLMRHYVALFYRDRYDTSYNILMPKQRNIRNDVFHPLIASLLSDLHALFWTDRCYQVLTNALKDLHKLLQDTKSQRVPLDVQMVEMQTDEFEELRAEALKAEPVAVPLDVQMVEMQTDEFEELRAEALKAEPVAVPTDVEVEDMDTEDADEKPLNIHDVVLFLHRLLSFYEFNQHTPQSAQNAIATYIRKLEEIPNNDKKKAYKKWRKILRQEYQSMSVEIQNIKNHALRTGMAALTL